MSVVSLGHARAGVPELRSNDRQRRSGQSEAAGIRVPQYAGSMRAEA